MKRVCFMLGLCAYLAVKTPSLLYKTNLLTLYEEKKSLFFFFFWDPHTTPKGKVIIM